ncbi:RES family NAD+ phosphorylase [Modestobacter sp. VKM Ac-2983]|uniref:RES family NAD+ phosphorylase n=1 Tax=Modestobacter sp. VKM Ac-2983 TaxID=3004137 RepID=UPI0022ABA1F0|nr:RES family NAD+ phosphorylase [Modestobacter sp. VKM Ac-2983]MCZ2807600.1 RES family NAD+ phosphorylase [Modestobacter sp. VKM Ac-2983]
MQRSTAERVAAVTPVRVEGTFHRHAALNRDAFAGGDQGRWGETFPVIYLGRPVSSVTAEAYRHLVEEYGIPAESVQPRRLYTVTVDVAQVLDLTDTDNLATVGLTEDDLRSPVDDYEACQRVAAAAHQLEIQAVLAPSATGLGETLAIFRERVTLTGTLQVQAEETWETLPADPRTAPTLSLVRRADAAGP